MTKEFLSYEQSILLNELGFDDYCIAYFDGNKPQMMPQSGAESNFYCIRNSGVQEGVLTRPLKQQAFRFFREKYGLNYLVKFAKESKRGRDYYWWSILSFSVDLEKMVYIIGEYEKGKLGGLFKTYEEAEEACLDKLIEIAKENKQ